MEKLFYIYTVGEDKDIQIDRLNPEQVLNFIFKLKDFERIAEPSKFIKSMLLKNILVNHQPYQPEEFEVYEYIDLIGEAVNLQLGLGSLGKSRILKLLGVDMEKIKEKISSGVMKMSLNQDKN